jgi:hypothetical protein
MIFFLIKSFHKKMHKNNKNGIVSGNTIRSIGYNQKTDRKFIIVGDEKIRVDKLVNSSYKNYKMKQYKNNYEDY